MGSSGMQAPEGRGSGPEQALRNPFWEFSVKVYAASGVAPECLRLQNSAGADVNVLLFCAWLGWERRIRLLDTDINAITGASRAWQANVVQPLRAVRRYAKGAASEAFYRSIATLELEAERHEQELLHAFWRATWGNDGFDDPCAAMQANIALYASSLDASAPLGGALSDLLRKALQAGSPAVGP